MKNCLLRNSAPFSGLMLLTKHRSNFKWVVISTSGTTCMDRYIAPCNICIHHLPVVYTGGRAMHNAMDGM